jgi:hypothetical protein
MLFSKALNRLVIHKLAIMDMSETPPSFENLVLDELRERIAPYLLRAAPESSTTVENPAAVLIAIIKRPEPSEMLTLRLQEMSLHAGQICFLGGRFQIGDEGFLHTALRKTEKETGISQDAVELAGFLDPYKTVTGYTVILVVGLLRGQFNLVPNRNEVDEIFEAPLAHLLNPANRERRGMVRNGTIQEFYAIDYEDRLIWGATAVVIVNFSRRLRER